MMIVILMQRWILYEFMAASIVTEISCHIVANMPIDQIFYIKFMCTNQLASNAMKLSMVEPRHKTKDILLGFFLAESE